LIAQCARTAIDLTLGSWRIRGRVITYTLYQKNFIPRETDPNQLETELKLGLQSAFAIRT
jgi:hypothetical protein